MLRLLCFLAALALAVPTVLAQPCPVGVAPVSPCAEVTLVALLDQADALGLTPEQRTAVAAIRDAELHAVHEILGDIHSLHETLHQLDQPYDPAEVFALFYEIDRHEVELGETFAGAERALVGVLSEAQRVRWAEILVAAAAVHEPEAAGASRGDAP